METDVANRAVRLTVALGASIGLAISTAATAQGTSTVGNPAILESVNGVQSSVTNLQTMIQDLAAVVVDLQGSGAWDKTISGSSRFVVLTGP